MDIIFIFLLGLIIASVLTGPVGWRHSRTKSAVGAWIFTLLVLIPALWLSMIWIPPTGPAVMGVYWLAPLLVGLLIMFLLAAAAPPPRRVRPGVESKMGQDQLAAYGFTAIFINTMFWLFLVGALALLAVSVVS